MTYDNKKDPKDRLSMRQSVMIWVVGAILGWLVAVASVYTALRVPESDVASQSPGTPETAPEKTIPPGEADRLQEILPAAGAKDGKTTPETDENGTP